MSDEDKQGEQPPPEPVAQEGNDDKGAEGQGEQPKGQEIEGPNADQNAENGSDVEFGVKSEGDAQQSMEETPQGGGKKKKRRLVNKTKKKTPFSLNSNIHLMPTEYNALKDSHLQSFFVNDRVRKHLRKMYLITGEGYIVEKPEEYRRNRQLLRQHYASQSVGAVSKKGKKDSMPYGDAQTGSTHKKKAKKANGRDRDPAEMSPDPAPRPDQDTGDAGITNNAEPEQPPVDAPEVGGD